MAKKGAKTKGKGKGKKGKKAGKKPAEPVVVEQPKEDPKEEQIIIIKERAIEEPCIFHCAQDTVTYRPNSYPGLLTKPEVMAVVGSEGGTYETLSKLLHSAFRCAERVYMMVPWGNYVAFRAQSDNKMIYFIFDGCTCNANVFRHWDLTCGTAGLLYFEEMHKMISYIISSRSRREELKSLKRCVVDDVSKERYGLHPI